MPMVNHSEKTAIRPIRRETIVARVSHQSLIVDSLDFDIFVFRHMSSLPTNSLYHSFVRSKEQASYAIVPVVQTPLSTFLPLADRYGYGYDLASSDEPL